MSMTSLNISLPVTMKDFVERQVQENGFSTPSEYIRSLVRDDQKRRVDEKFDELLLEGLKSGDGIEITPEYWEKKRAQLLERHKKTGTR